MGLLATPFGQALRALAITLVEIKFARKSMQVFYRLATQRKSLRKFNLPLLASPFDQGFKQRLLFSPVFRTTCNLRDMNDYGIAGAYE